jgi:hypothetical protein
MTLDGTVVNGMIVLDSGVILPNGARIRVEVADDNELVPPSETYDRDQEIAILRESLADVQAGRGVIFDEFMAKLAADHR